MQGKILEADVEAETMEKCCLLTYFSWLPQPACLYKSDPPAHGRLVLSILISNQENAPQIRPQANLMEALFFSLESPSSQMILVCIKLTKKNLSNTLS